MSKLPPAPVKVKPYLLRAVCPHWRYVPWVNLAVSIPGGVRARHMAQCAACGHPLLFIGHATDADTVFLSHPQGSDGGEG